MSRPLFRALTLDPNKRIRLLIDQHDDNNNDLPHPHSTSSSSSNNLLVSYSSTSNLQTSQHSTVSNSRLPQRCAPQMPFVSGMEREEEEEYHLQTALDAQRRLGSAKIRAVPIPDLYEDLNSQTIYPANVNLPKQLIRLQPLQLESDEPDYDMDKIDQDWFESVARTSLPNLTHLQYETIIDQLENASTRIRISFDEARSLLPSFDELDLKSVYEFWYQRRTTRDKRLKFRLLTERDIKEEKGKQHPYVVFRRRVEKMTTRKNRKNDEQAYMSMLKLRSNFEAVVKLTNMIKVRETSKASLLKCALSIFQARCECKADEDPVLLASTSNNVTLPSNNDRQQSAHHHARSSLKTSLLMNSTNHLTASQQQQLLTKISRFDQQKKASLSSSTLASLLQAPIQQTRSLSNDSNDSFQPKIKRFKGSNSSSKKLLKTVTSTDKLTQLLSSPTTPSTGLVHNLPFPPTLTNTPQSLLERLSPGNIFTSQQSQQQSLPPGKRRSKNSPSGTIKQSKNPRNLSQNDLWASLSENLPAAAILLKAQLDAPKRLQQQKEDLENNTSRRVILQDGSAVLSNSNENINNSVDGDGTSVDDEESNDPWQFRPKAGCRYLRPIDQDQQQQQHELRPQKRSAFAAFYYVTCSEQGHLGKRRVRLGRGGRLLYDRHVEQENKDFTSNSSDVSHIIDKPMLWRLSSRPNLKDSYRLHSHLTVEDHTRSLAHHYQSNFTSDSFELNDEFYHHHHHHHHVNTSTSTSTIELDHPYSCSSRHIHQALRTLSEPTPPSPSSSPSPPLPLTSSHSITPVQQMILISTPPTPPLSSSTSNQMDIDVSPHSQTHETDASHFYSKSSSAFILSPTTFFPPNSPTSYLLPSGSPTSTTVVTSPANTNGQPSSPISSKSSCARVQFVQMHRIHHPPSAPHQFASSTPVTTSDS